MIVLFPCHASVQASQLALGALDLLLASDAPRATLTCPLACTCPNEECNYDSARGDQCGKGGKLLNPTELKDPRCKACQNTPRIREFPLLNDKLVEYINEMSVDGSWSQNAINTHQAAHVNRPAADNLEPVHHLLATDCIQASSMS